MVSGMRDRRSVPFPGPGFQDFFHLREREVAFLFAIVKMRREAHASLGTEVHENLARKKFAANFVGVRAIDRNRSGALRRIKGSVDAPATRLRALDEPRGHEQRFLANGLDSHLIQNVETGAAS